MQGPSDQAGSDAVLSLPVAQRRISSISGTARMLAAQASVGWASSKGCDQALVRGLTVLGVRLRLAGMPRLRRPTAAGP